MTDDRSPCLRVSVVNAICSTLFCAGPKTGGLSFVLGAEASDSPGADVPGPLESFGGGGWSSVGQQRYY